MTWSALVSTFLGKYCPCVLRPCVRPFRKVLLLCPPPLCPPPLCPTPSCPPPLRPVPPTINPTPTADYEELSDEELPETEESTEKREGKKEEGEEKTKERKGQDGEEEEEVPAWIFVSVNYDPYSFRPAPLSYFYTPTSTFYQKNAKRIAAKNIGVSCIF